MHSILSDGGLLDWCAVYSVASLGSMWFILTGIKLSTQVLVKGGIVACRR